MKQQKRKGFTLVELLIVIAILAVLATVSIVGYTQFIQKAHISNDAALVNQLNDLLMANEVIDGKAPTMSAALEIAGVNGFDVTKFTPTAKNYSYIWDSQTNRFLLINENQQVITPSDVQLVAERSFAVAHNLDELNKWQEKGVNIYLADDYEGSKDFAVHTGFDAGTCQDVESITYTGEVSAKTIILRSNSDKTTLSATAFVSGTPGAADYTCDTINAYGLAGKVIVPNAGASSFHWFGQTQGYIEATNGHVVAEEGSQGIIKAMTNDVIIDVADSADVLVVPGEKGVTLSAVAPNVPADKTNSIKPSTDYAGGLGTKDHPYLIQNFEQLKKIYGTNSSHKFYKLIADIHMEETMSKTDAETGEQYFVYVSKPINNVTLDGQGFKLITAKNTVAYIFDSVKKSTFKNIDVEETAALVRTANADNGVNGVSFINVDTYGDIQASGNCAAYVQYAIGKMCFENCTNYASIMGTGTRNYNAIFVGYPMSRAQTLKFTNCINEGSIISGKASMFVGNAKASYLNLTIEGCRNNGTIKSTYVGEDYNMNYYVSSIANDQLNIKINGAESYISINKTLQGLSNVNSDNLIKNTGSVVNDAEG